MLVTEHLFGHYPDRTEGELSKLRARVVRATTLARRARSLGLGGHLLLGRGEERGGGRAKASILADAFEALVAAIYLDGGLEEARRFVLAQLEAVIQEAAEARDPADHKSSLQALSQKRFGCIPKYRVISEHGPDHDKRFRVEVTLDGRLSAEGWGRSKKTAEQEAARVCWCQLEESSPVEAAGPPEAGTAS
jgi:ribonuclease III